MRKREPFGGQERSAHGFILQAVGPHGERRWFLRNARPHSNARLRAAGKLQVSLKDELRAVVAQLDALPGDWKVEVISSPSTIYRDLQGSRRKTTAGGTRRAAEADFLGQQLVLPEAAMLGQIGRSDMLASRDAGAA